MHRLLVILLAAFDAVVAAVVTVAVAVAPLTLLWAVGLGGADWAALWPTAGSLWQLGHLVPLPLSLPDAYLAATGIDAAAATFTISLAPLAVTLFTAISAARSGSRAARADALGTGLATGGGVFAIIAAVIALTTANPVAHPALWQAILFPALVYGVGAALGAAVADARDGSGPAARLRDRIALWPGEWRHVPAIALRCAAVAVTGMFGLGALTLAVAVALRGGDIIALYEAGGMDALGGSLVTAAQLLYLPTLIVWAMSWVAGPGFALGVGTAVSPAGTQLGVVPGIPILGAIPESVSPMLLLVILLPIAVGVLAGWVARSALLASRTPADPAWVVRTPADEHEPVAPRAALAAGIAVLTGAVVAVLAALASGGIGPDRLSHVGAAPGPVALAVGLEVLLGASILLLSPRRMPHEESQQESASADGSRADRPMPLPPVD